MKNLAIVGIGDWGRNILRNLNWLAPGITALACDVDEDRLAWVSKHYPTLETSSDYHDILEREDIGAVVLATPSQLHFEQALTMLESGRDILIEKPMAISSDDGEKLVEIAEEKQSILMVGHIMAYHPAAVYLKSIINEGQLGKVYYLYCNRTNFGKVRETKNVLWSFGPQDVALLLYLLDKEPVRISANGVSYLKPGIEDVVFLVIHFGDGTIAQIHVSWLNHLKERNLTVVGSKKMAVFNDMDPAYKLALYDKVKDQIREYGSYGEYMSLRTGDVVYPKISSVEPLAAELKYFLDRLENREAPLTDGRFGVKVLNVLEAAEKSIEAGGAPVTLDTNEEQ